MCATWPTAGGKSSPAAPSATPDPGSIWISTRSKRWPSTWPKPSPVGPSKRSSAPHSNASVTTSPVPNARVPARFKEPHGPWPSAAGRSRTTNQSATARLVAGIFFPLRPTLRLDSHTCSPAILGKILRAAARAGSFREAAESVADLAEVAISDRQVGRIAHDVGEQLRQARDQQVDDFQGRRLVPRTTVAPKLAVVSVDGGRFQTRTEGQGPGVHDPAWREDKVADLVTMSTRSHDQDPHPELPRCFTQNEAVVELVPGITSQGALADVIDPTAEEAVPLTVVAPAEHLPEPSWPPEPLVRTCQATTDPSEAFGPMVAAEAQRRHFFAAERRAFLGDGGPWIWTIHRAFFPTFEPIVDFVHVLTYVYLAAKALGGGAGAVWGRDLGWATACWPGRVADVLAELRWALEGMTPPAESREEKPTDPYHVVSKTIG